MANGKKAKTSSVPKKKPAQWTMTAEEDYALDLTPVETIRLSPEDAKSLEALRLFVKAYEKL